MEDFTAIVESPNGEIENFHYDLAWANQIVEGDIKAFSESATRVQSLIDLGIHTFPISSYTIAKFNKSNELVMELSTDNTVLVDAVIMDYMIKSAAWEGKDISKLDAYYRIRQSYVQLGEVHDYYAYLLPDGTPVLQYETQGRYSALSKTLYSKLVELFK